MHRIVYVFLLANFLISQSTHGQTLMTFDSIIYPNPSIISAFYWNELGDCITNDSSVFSPIMNLGITITPDSVVYGYGKSLVSNWLTNGLYFYDFPEGFNDILDFEAEIPTDTLIEALACDYDGLLYLAGKGLSTYHLGWNYLVYKGDFPPGMYAGGDLTYRLGEFYMTTKNNELVHVDTETPANSSILATFPDSIPLIQGLATFPFRCDSIITYAIGMDSTGSKVYVLDFDDYSLSYHCHYNRYNLDAASYIESVLPPCEIYVDLDMDNSAGTELNNYTVQSCTSPIPISDQDVEVFSPYPFDSIRITLNGILNPGQEYLLSNFANTIEIQGDGTSEILLINPGTATESDFAAVIKAITYHNEAANMTFGERQVIVQMYSSFYTAIPSISSIRLEDDYLQLEALIDTPSCFGVADGTATLQGELGVEPYSFTWPDGLQVDQRDNLSSGEYIIEIEDSAGCRGRDTFYIDQPENLLLNITASQDSVCGATGTLMAQVAGGTAPYNYDWNNENNLAENANLSPGTYTLTITDSENCTTEGSYTLFEIPNITITQSEIRCQGESFPFNGFTFTADTSFCQTFITASGCDSTHCLNLQFLDTVLVQEYTSICQGEAFEIDGQQLVNDTTLCLIYQAANGCDSTYCVTLEVLENETNIQAGVCEGETYDFNGQQLSQSGTYTATYLGSNGCDSLVVLELTVTALPEVDLATIGTFCTDETVQIQAGSHAAYQWSTGESTDEITVTLGGTYHLTVTNEAGCTNSDSISVSEDQIDFIVSTIAPSCFGGSDAQIIIDSVWGGQAPYLFSINDGPLQQTLMIGSLEAGNYTIVAEDTEGCRQQTTIQIEAPAESTLQLGNDLELALGDSVTLKAIANFTPTSIQWTPQAGLNCDTCLSVMAQPIYSITYAVTAIDSNNCVLTDEVRLIVNRQKGIYIPSAFSPNNDGINDRFTLYSNSSVATISSFQIFDRWGGLIYKNTDLLPAVPTQGWDGTIGGQIAANGIYVYAIEIIRIDGSVETLAGEVLLLR